MRQETSGPDEIERVAVDTAEETKTIEAGRVITQVQITDLHSAREEVKAASALKKEAEARVKALEAGIMTGLKKELPVEGGPFLAEIETKLGQCRPAWKDEFEKAMGPEAVQEVVANTPRKPKEVINVGPNPHWKA